MLVWVWLGLQVGTRTTCGKVRLDRLQQIYRYVSPIWRLLLYTPSLPTRFTSKFSLYFGAVRVSLRSLNRFCFMMRSSTALATLLSASALASPRPEVEVIQVREIARRQGDASSLDLGALSACIPPSSIASLADAIPTAPSGVLSALLSNTNPCQLPSFTGSVGSQYSSYTSALSEWNKENSSKIQEWESSYMTACPYAATMSIPALTPSETALAFSLASCGATTTGKGNTVTGAQATGSGASTGAAPQQTAFAAAVGAVAGIVGLVAAGL